MDILYELSYLFFQDSESLDNKDPDYRNLKQLESQLLELIATAAGQELRDKLTDVQVEIAYHNLLQYFLCGLRLGFAASDPGQGG